MKAKMVYVTALTSLILLVGCNQYSLISLDECTDSINGQYYLKDCEQYKDYEIHYNLRTEWEANLPNSSYTIDRNYNECIWSNETYYFDYEPVQENAEHLHQVDCPEDSDIFYGAVFCYKRAIKCNETWNYKNGTKEKHDFAI